MSIFSGEAIWIENEDLINFTSRSFVTQRIKLWSGEGGAADAIISEDQIGINFRPLRRGEFLHRRELRLNGAMLGLLFTGNASVNRHALG